MRVLLCGFAVGVTLVCSTTYVAGQADTVYRPGNGVSLPVPTKNVQPTYTREATVAHVQGDVIVEVIVSSRGAVKEARVIRSLDDNQFGLDKQALEAAKQWQFRPGTKDGKPVAVVSIIRLMFTLK